MAKYQIDYTIKCIEDDETMTEVESQLANDTWAHTAVTDHD